MNSKFEQGSQIDINRKQKNFMLEHFPIEILLQIISNLSFNDKLKIRQVNKKFKQLTESKFIWSGDFHDFYKPVNIKPTVIYNFRHKMLRGKLSANEFSTMIQNMKLSNGEEVIPIDEENSVIVERAKNNTVDHIRTSMQEFPNIISAITMLTVIFSGVIVLFVGDIDMEFWSRYHCAKVDQISTCTQMYHDYLIKNCFFSAPGAYGAGSILNAVDRGIDYVISKKYLTKQLENSQEQNSNSKLAWSAYKMRNLFALVVWTAITLLLLRLIKFSFDVNINECYSDFWQADKCAVGKYRQQENANFQFVALISVFAGYFFPIAANSVFNKVKECIHKPHSPNTNNQKNIEQNSIKQLGNSVATTAKNITNFFLSKKTDVQNNNEEELSLLFTSERYNERNKN